MTTEVELGISNTFLKESKIFDDLGLLKFQEIVDKSLFCESCTFLLWRPVNLPCNHTVCLNCVISKDESGEISQSCPTDGELVTDLESLINAELQSKLESLSVHCIETSCEWIGKLNDLESHFIDCEFKHLPCEHCSQLVPQNQQEQHLKTECTINNKEQAGAAPTADVAVINEVVEEPVQCPNKCKSDPDDPDKITMLRPSDVDMHVNNECEERIVTCPFNVYGCPKSLKIKKIGSHFNKYSILHLNNLSESLKTNESSLEKEINALMQIKEQMTVNSLRLKSVQLRHGPQILLKIVEVKEKLESLLSNKSTEFAETHFYSTYPYGYKINMKVSISSNKTGTRYLSIHISLCDSNFNSLLTWPFLQKIDLFLINQKCSNHITHSIMPNPVKENFPFIQRPMTQRNPYFGIEKFAKLLFIEDESDFVVDDIMYIKVNVEPHSVV